MANKALLVKDINGKASIVQTVTETKDQNRIETSSDQENPSVPNQKENSFEYSLIEPRNRLDNGLRWDYLVKHKSDDVGLGDKQWDYVVQHDVLDNDDQDYDTNSADVEQKSVTSANSNVNEKKDDIKSGLSSKSTRWDYSVKQREGNKEWNYVVEHV